MRHQTFWDWVNEKLNWNVWLNKDGFPVCDINRMPVGHKGKSLDALQRIYNQMHVPASTLKKFQEHVSANEILRKAGITCDTRNFQQNMLMITTPKGNRFKYYPNYKSGTLGAGTIQPYGSWGDDWDFDHDRPCGYRSRVQNMSGEQMTLTEIIRKMPEMDEDMTQRQEDFVPDWI